MHSEQFVTYLCTKYANVSIFTIKIGVQFNINLDIDGNTFIHIHSRKTC